MNKTSINTFIKGMNKDIDKSVISKDSYLDAQNFRIVTSEGSSSGAFENWEGNKVIELAASPALFPENQLVCGSVRLRDYIIIFTTSNTAAPVHGVGRSMIHKLTLDKDAENADTVTVLYDDSLNAGTGDDTLDFSTLYKIKAISKYETSNIQKVYWTDGYNNIRYADVAKNLTITGATYAGNDYMATSMFEFLPALTPVKPTLVDIVSGNLNSGMVQYSYQLYRLNGAETAYSPVSGMIHLTTDNDFGSNTLTYKGDETSVNTGKGCRLSIVNADTGYDRLRLIRIHYSTLNSIPVIAVANEIEISTAGGTVNITDTGETVSSLTLDEFNISSTELFKCEDIATKDSRLFTANIEKSEFTIDIDDFDPRVVRFKAASTATVYDGVTPLEIAVPAGDTPAQWNTAGWSSYIETHDGINQFNDPDNDGNAAFQWMYQSDGVTLGAEGPYVKIDFETSSISLDISNDDTTFYSTVPTDGTDLSYKNYASPWKGDKLSWQRDEVYRLFVVWGNDRGQKTSPQWMIDLRMPSLHDSNFNNGSAVLSYPSILGLEVPATGEIISHILYPRVYFKDFPTGATWAQIYRVKRERQDRFVVTQGFVIPSYLDLSIYRPDECDAALLTTEEIVKIVSPEINITKNVSFRSSDYLEYITNFSASYAETAELSYSGAIHKMLGNTRVAFSSNTKTEIIDAVIIDPDVSIGGSIIINSLEYGNFNEDTTPNSAKGCTGLLIAYDNASWSAEGQNRVVVNYKSNVYGSQYGGHTYESRTLNVSIPCSDVITATDVDAYVDISYGDTFINYFDVSTLLADLTQGNINDTYAETLYVPLESSINCDLRHDIEARHYYPNPHPVGVLRQEYTGDHIIAPVEFNQTKNLYLYNTVYSQQGSAQYAISSIFDATTETDFDCLVKASNIKYTGENSDSWTKFSVNEEIEVDSNYGPILALSTVNDKLLYWQEDGFGILSVNTRSLIQDSSSAQLALGTGGLLDRYDYISSTIGILDKFAIVNSDTAVYWFYDKDHSIYKFDNKLANLAKEKGMWSWFKNFYSANQSVHGVYDRKYNDVLFTLYENGTTGYTLAFNEQEDQFACFCSFVPRLYIDYKDGFLSVKDFVTGTYSYLFMHNSNINPRCRFYSLVAHDMADSTNTYASTVKLMHNEDYPITKVYDNIFYISNAFDSNDIEQYDTTFDQVRCYNDYQNSDWVTLTYPTNIMRRDRSWTLVVPRNKVEVDYDSGGNIFTAGNLDEVRSWHERIRDKYMVVDLSFDNSTGDRFVVPFIGIKYRISMR